jgi:2-dehydropantoate 2-reductase
MDVGPVDVIILGVKTYQIAEAAAAMRPMLGPATFVVPLQNGVEASSQLAEMLGEENVVGGLCGTISWREGPGRIMNAGGKSFVRFGERDDRPSPRLERLRQAFEHASVDAAIAPNIETALWEKFIFGVPFGGVAAVADTTAGGIRSRTPLRQMVRNAMEEIEEVAHVRGVQLRHDIVEHTLGLLDALEPGTITSLQRDLSAGRPTELDALSGAVVRLGRESGVATPTHEHIYTTLLPKEMQARNAMPGNEPSTIS